MKGFRRCTRADCIMILGLKSYFMPVKITVTFGQFMLLSMHKVDCEGTWPQCILPFDHSSSCCRPQTHQATVDAGLPAPPNVIILMIRIHACLSYRTDFSQRPPQGRTFHANLPCHLLPHLLLAIANLLSMSLPRMFAALCTLLIRQRSCTCDQVT